MSIAVTAAAAETREIHTRLLRLGLAVEECREYWRQAVGDLGNAELTRQAFEQRWFGAKSAARVAYLISSLGLRFKAYPGALLGLKAWDPVEVQDRRWVCHWHLQLSDPLYRAFTQQYLGQRLRHPEPTVEKLSALEWLRKAAPGRWGAATAERLVSGLVSSACEAGFCTGVQSPRPLCVPAVSDRALAYLLFALRDIELEGTLLANAYLDSAKLVGDSLIYRVQKLAGFSYHKRGNVGQLEWGAANFVEWIGACE